MKINPTCRFAIAEEALLRDHRLSHGIKQVYVTLKLFHNRRQGQCWPKRKQVAAVVGCTANFVSYATQRLVEFGYLEKRRNRGGRSKSAIYRFPLVENATHLTGISVAKAIRAVGGKEQTNIQFRQTNPLLQDLEWGPRSGSLILPTGLNRKTAGSILRQVRSLPLLLAQAVLDELAGAMRAREIKNPSAYVRSLILSACHGSFVPQQGASIADARNTLRTHDRQRQAPRTPPQPKKSERSQWTPDFDALREQLGLPIRGQE